METKLAVLALSTIVLVAAATSLQESGTRDQWGVLTPFWASDTMTNESMFFVSDGDQAASAPLLFKAERVLLVQSADRKTRYVEGKDYAVGPDSRSIVALPGSRIPSKTRAELYPQANAEHAIAQRADGKAWLLFGEGDYFHDLQVNVTYTHDDKWRGAVPKFEDEKLARTIAKLRARKRLTVAVSGDSISAGGNASLFTKAEPRQPAYPQLVVDALQEVYGAKVVLKNRAVGGWRTDEGAGDAANVAKDNPDLVVIAYGMNDREPKLYSENVGKIMETIRAKHPDAEFLLVAPMTGNPEWSRMQMGKFAKFREALMACSGPGVAVADVTTLWQEVLASKRFLDLTGNGVNHPNDFGHRLYAQAILGLMIDGYGKR